jgi:hypothetical protein
MLLGGVKESDVIYLAGLVDGLGSFEVNVSSHPDYATGYRFEPKFRMNLRESDAAVLGMLDEYCDEVGVNYSIETRSDSDLQRFIVQDPCDITNFVNPFGDYLIRRYEAAVIMLNDILPEVKDGKHTTKQGLLELMESADKLRESMNRNRETKYTKEWFEKEWEEV